MKVLWLSHLIPFPPQGVGVLQRSSNLLKIAASAHDVTLLAFNQNDLLRIYNHDLDIALSAAMKEMEKLCLSVQIINIECDKKAYGKARLAFRSLFSNWPYTIRWLTSDAYKDALTHELGKHKYDVIWFDTISLAQYRQAIPSNHSKLILNHHNIESDMMYRRAEKETNYLKKLYFRLEAFKLKKYEKSEVGKYDINVTCSDLDSRRLDTISPGANTHVIPNGVNTDFFIPSDEVSSDPYSLVFIGGMSWYPNREAMLFFAREVWPELKKQIPDIKMHVVGENPPQELQDLAKIDNNFRVYGFVDNIKDIFDQSEIYVCPISDGGGTKLKILDALAMGKPIVANEIACEGIGVTNRLNVLFAETPSEYVARIRELISDPSLRHTLSHNSRKLIREVYSYDVVGRDLVRLLEN